MLASSPRGEGVFAPETILPEQYFSSSASCLQQPEKRLMLAVLEDAVATLFKYAADLRPAARRLVRDTEVWVAARDHDWPFSFESICAALNLDASAVRRGLRRLQASGPCPEPVRVLPFTTRRHVSGNRHRVAAPRAHRRTRPLSD